MQECQIIAKPTGLTSVMGYKDNGNAFGMRLQNQLLDRLGGSRVQAGSWLIEKQHPGRAGQGPRHREPLLLANRQKPCGPARDIAEPRLRKCVCFPLRAFSPADSPNRQCEAEIGGGRPAQHHRPLKHHRLRAAAGPAEGLAVPQDLSGGRRK